MASSWPWAALWETQRPRTHKPSFFSHKQQIWLTSWMLWTLRVMNAMKMWGRSFFLLVSGCLMNIVKYFIELSSWLIRSETGAIKNERAGWNNPQSNWCNLIKDTFNEHIVDNNCGAFVGNKTLLIRLVDF